MMIIHPNYQVLYPEDPNYRCNLEVTFLIFKISAASVSDFDFVTSDEEYLQML